MEPIPGAVLTSRLCRLVLNRISILLSIDQFYFQIEFFSSSEPIRPFEVHGIRRPGQGLLRKPSIRRHFKFFFTTTGVLKTNYGNRTFVGVLCRHRLFAFKVPPVSSGCLPEREINRTCVNNGNRGPSRGDVRTDFIRQQSIDYRRSRYWPTSVSRARAHTAQTVVETRPF